MLEKGADQFTANSIFWIVILIGLVFYTALVLLGVSLFDLYKRLRNKNNSNKLDIQTDIDEQVINPRDTTEINSSENIKVLKKIMLIQMQFVKFNIRKKFNKKTKNYK